jgi:glycosyltransferase involved in cell wall biosynthesis
VPTLHVVIPVYNERNTLSPCVRRVLASPLPAEWDVRIQLIDDHSDDAHFPAVEALAHALEHERQPITLHRHEINKGKGAALQTGFDIILALPEVRDDDLVIIQDADLEYDPDDYSRLMQPIIDGKADAVVGTRWGEHRPLPSLKHKVHALGNGVLTLLSNMMTGYRVSDMECCYKVVPVHMLRNLRPLLSENRFGIEPQYVAALARLRARVAEVPVNYDPRGLAEGKKIGWRDGVRALIVIARERFKGRQPRQHVARKDSAEISA